MEIKYWVLCGVVFVAYWLIQLIINKFIVKFDETIKSIDNLRITIAVIVENQLNFKDSINKIEIRLKKVEDDVNDIEKNCIYKHKK